jgi:hypothetical protein
MFEREKTRATSSFWKFLPAAVAVLLLLVGVIAYLAYLDTPEEVDLGDILRQGDERFDWYQPYVELWEPKLQMGLSFAGKRIVMFSGVVANRGDRAIDVVELKVVFYNYDEPAAETIRTPIRPGPYTPPVQALSERAFSFYIEEIPPNWLSAHAEMYLHGLRFVDPN